MSNTNICSDIYEIHSDLLRHLVKEGKVTEISKQFAALKTNANRVSFIYKLLGGYDLFPATISDLKSDAKALEFRQKGNLFYKNRKIIEALEFYTRSIANASGENEELALAYGNRSAVLFEMGFYKECLKDIQKAQEHNYPDGSKQKLLTRQVTAKKLESTQCNQPYYEKIPEISGDIKNPSIQSATNSVKLEFSKVLGRHVVATKDIQIGEIIAVEKPFCTVLIKDITCHCHECLELCYNPLPCPKCTEALFCSENCLEKAEKYHQHECSILKTIRHFNLDKMKLIAFRIALTIKEEYTNLASNMALKDKEMYYSNRYKEIHNLVANTNLRTPADLFKKATVAAILLELVKKFTTFLENQVQEEAFKEILLLHMQIAPCNFHQISEMIDINGVFEQTEVGAGAFSFLSMFNHSCNPNLTRDCYGTSIVARALRTIKRGEQCFENYGYHHAMTPKLERQTSLKEQYFFDCSCEACINDWPLYSNLPIIGTNVSTDEYYQKLLRGDRTCAKEVWNILLPLLKELEETQPNKIFSELQEILKQCFVLQGSVKMPIQ